MRDRFGECVGEGVFDISANVAPTAPPVTAPLAKQHLGYSLLLPVFTDANGDTLTYTWAICRRG